MIYLACPYSHPNELKKGLRFTLANMVAAYLMERRGKIVFSPISHSHPIDQWVENGNHDFWLNQDKAFLDAADEIYVLCVPGWEKSHGVQWEIDYMIKSKKPVTYIDENCNEIFPV